MPNPGPPPGWDPGEAAERVRARAHALPDHQAWLEEKGDKGEPLHHCWYCDGGEPPGMENA